MGYGLKLVVLFTFMCLLFISGVLLFARGFLLKRIVIDDKTSCNQTFNGKLHSSRWLLGSTPTSCWMDSRYKKAVIIVIDALRYDFAYFNESLAEDKALPYQNKLTAIHEALKMTPTQARLYKFIADAPTTTMQRLKGLTTGSLPTFVDAGSNFASYEIKEDNFISKLVENNKKITFMGDDTWLDLFPKAFHKSYHYPSFNVKDLHTVDNGVNRHLMRELQGREWDLLIGHYLGVDHCGHTYGPYHPEMAKKLSQMNQVLKSVMTSVEDDTILFVLGDHGMTRTGDHGGDSTDELSAALFVYTKKQLNEVQNEKITYTISQVDLVPTISLLLGLPVPFGNLGTAITDLFIQSDIRSPIAKHLSDNMDKVEWVKKLAQIEVLHLNALQVNQYLMKYKEISGEIPEEKLSALTNIFTKAEIMFNKIQDLYHGNVSDLGKQISIQTLSQLEETYRSYTLGVKALCEDMWAKFDLLSIVAGVMLQAFLLCLMLWIIKDIQLLKANIATVLVISALCTVFGVAAFVVLPHRWKEIMIITLCGAFIFCTLTVLARFGKSIAICLCYIWKSRNSKDCLTLLLFISYMAGMFSNSYIVYEDSSLTFLVSSLILGNVVSTIYSPKLSSSKPVSKAALSNKKQKKEPKKLSLWSFLLSEDFRILVAAAVFVFFGRLSAAFRACREEQIDCQSSSFLQSLGALVGTGVNLNERFILSTMCIGSIPFAVRQWLSYQGNLNGATPAVLCVKYALPFVVIFTCGHWALQIIPSTASELLPTLQLWQQIVLPEFAYWLCLLTLTLLLWQPLCIYTVLPDSHSNLKNSISSYGSGDPLDSRTMQLVYKKMKNWGQGVADQVSGGKVDPPLVYGLGSVYSSAILILVCCLALPLVLVLGDGMVGSVVLLLFQMVLCLEMEAYMAGHQARQNILQGPCWHSVVVWSLLSSQWFYSTGHQTTIPAIRFEAAFVGLPGTMSNFLLPGLLIFLNTFASHILFAVALPLLLLWPRLTSRLLTKAPRTSSTSTDDKGEFALSDYPDNLREQMFRLLLLYQLCNASKVFAAACSAALHRRHLMVWKVFAPRFVFESAAFLVSVPFLVFIYLAFLRIDAVLEIWTEGLAQYCEERVKLS